MDKNMIIAIGKIVAILGVLISSIGGIYIHFIFNSWIVVLPFVVSGLFCFYSILYLERMLVENICVA